MSHLPPHSAQAGSELIDVRPTESFSKLQFVSGNYGPLTAGVNSKVPLWLALTLKEGKKARVIVPGWLKAPALRRAIESEDSQETFHSLPFHYAEIAEALLQGAEDDFVAEGEKPDEVHDLFARLKHVRASKLQQQLSVVLNDSKREKREELHQAIPIDNLGALEIAELRDGFMRALDEIASLDVARQTAATAATSRSRAAFFADEPRRGARAMADDIDAGAAGAGIARLDSRAAVRAGVMARIAEKAKKRRAPAQAAGGDEGGAGGDAGATVGAEPGAGAEPEEGAGGEHER